MIYLSQDTASGTAASVIRVRVNNDSTSGNYVLASRIGAINGVVAASGVAATSGGGMIGIQPNAGMTSVAMGGEFMIPYYANTTWHKEIMSSFATDETTDGVIIFTAAFRWKSTAAITRLTVNTDGTAFTNGSIFTLYGIL